MSVGNATNITFDQVFALAQRLRPMDQARLVARLAPTVESLLEQVEPTASSLLRPPLRGLLADLGPAPSAEEIDEVQLVGRFSAKLPPCSSENRTTELGSLGRYEQRGRQHSC